MRSQVDSLFRHSRIRTTLQKAKESQRMAEKLITLAKRGYIIKWGRLLRKVRDKGLVKYLFDEIAPRYAERDGGYTRVIKAGLRSGDAAQMAILELID